MARLARVVVVDVGLLGQKRTRRKAGHQPNFGNHGNSQGGVVAFVDTKKLDVIERLPGWHGRYFHAPSMTLAHYDFVRGASIHEHSCPQEEIYEVLEGELEVTIDGMAQIARPGLVAIIPSGILHSVKALTDGRAIIVDCPRRAEFG